MSVEEILSYAIFSYLYIPNGLRVGEPVFTDTSITLYFAEDFDKTIRNAMSVQVIYN